MNKKKDLVKKGYTELDYDSRKEIREFITDFEKKDFSERKLIKESVQKSLGPTSNSPCPCCGK